MSASGPIPRPARAAWKRVLLSESLVLFLSAAYFIALAPFTPGLASGGNILDLLSSLLPLFVACVGQTLVLIAGGIDLSATSVIALASVAGAAAMSDRSGLLGGTVLAAPAGILVMLGVGSLAGLLNGAAIVAFRMPAFIVTLTAMMFWSGLAVLLTGSKNISGQLPAAFKLLGGGTGAGLAVEAAVVAAFAALASLVLHRTLLGRWLFAVGRNPRASLISGVPVGAVTVAAYAAGGLCAGAASVLYTARLETGSPVLGQRMLLDIIAATVIGGSSLFGGKGKVSWTFSGVLFIALLDNSLNLLGLSQFAILMVKGGVILFAALMDSLRNRLLEG